MESTGTPSCECIRGPEPEPVARLRAVLDAAGVRYRILQHEISLNSARDGVDHGFGCLAQMTPTLILRSETGYLAAIICGDTRLSYRKIKKQLGLRDVSMASPDEVQSVTGAAPGSVAMINPGLRTLVDARVLEQDEVFGGCGVSLYSLAVGGADLARAAGAQVFDFTEPRNP